MVALYVLLVLPTKLASAFQSRAAITASPRPSSFIPQVYKIQSGVLADAAPVENRPGPRFLLFSARL